MNVINQNTDGFNINHNRPGFKSDVMVGPFPGMIMPQNQDSDEFQNSQNEPGNNLPDLYYMPENYKKPKTFVDKLKKVDVMGLISSWFEHPLLMLGTAMGISMGVDAFDKSCNKEYEKSVVGRAAKFGDKIHESKFIRKEGTQKFLGGIKTGWGKFKNLLMKSNVVRAMVETPSNPEYSTPKQELKSMDYRIVEKFKDLAKRVGLVPTSDTVAGDIELNLKLKDLILDGKEEEYIKKTFNVNKLSKAPREEAVNRIILQRLGKSEAEISSLVNKSNATGSVLKELLQKSGLTDAELKRIFEDEVGSKEIVQLVDKACVNLQNLKVANGRLVFPGKVQPLANIESFRGIHNRIQSMTIGAGARTETGRFMAKAVQKLHKMFTFGSNKLGVLFWITPMMVATILNTIKADRKEKVGTAASGIINSFAWVLYFPLVVKALYALGGIQYAGMGKEKVEEMNNLINKFNARTKLDNAECFKTKAEYKEAKNVLEKKIKDLRKVKNQNFLTKTLRGISKFTKSDLMKIESFQGGSPVGNFFRRIPNKMKDLFLGRGRMLVFLLAAIPLVDKIIEKGTNKIFGKGYDEFKENDIREAKEKEEEFTINNLRSRLVEIQNNKLNPTPETANANSATNALNNLSPNLPPKTTVPESMKKLAELAEQNQEKTVPEENIIAKSEPVQLNDDSEESDDITPIIAENNSEEALPKEFTADLEPENSYEEPTPDVQAELPEETLNTPKNLLTESENLNSTDPEQSIEEMTSVQPQYSQANNFDVKKVTEPVRLDNYTYIPSSENIINKLNPAQTINKYIPAQTPAKFDKIFDNSGLEAAIRRADRAEKRALDVLAGNFGNA